MLGKESLSVMAVSQTDETESLSQIVRQGIEVIWSSEGTNE